jgi:ribonuclease HI
MPTETTFTAFTDGCAEPNPGHAAGGFILKDDRGRQIQAAGFYIGDGHSCNEAEYTGILRAVEAAIARGATRLDIFADSNLVVCQIQGRWKIKAANLQEYHRQIMELLAKIPSWRITWVPRSMNSAADIVAGNAARFRRDVSYDMPVHESTYANSIRSAVSDFYKQHRGRMSGHRSWGRAKARRVRQ